MRPKLFWVMLITTILFGCYDGILEDSAPHSTNQNQADPDPALQPTTRPTNIPIYQTINNQPEIPFVNLATNKRYTSPSEGLPVGWKD